MTEITWPCGGHKYEDGVGVVCVACHDAEVDRLKRGLAERDERVRELEAALGKIVYEAERDDEDDLVCEGEVIAHLATLARIALAAARKETP